MNLTVTYILFLDIPFLHSGFQLLFCNVSFGNKNLKIKSICTLILIHSGNFLLGYILVVVILKTIDH